MNELHLFAGAGGGILAGELLGHRCVCAVEWEPYAAAVLAQRQNDGLLPPFPIWDDVRTFDGRPWRGLVDVVAGGFPCQDISVAGKGAGITGERSGMWSEMARIVGEVRPRIVFVENSPALITRGLGVVLSDLAALGYDCRWTVLGAADVGAPHRRDRFWLLANARGERYELENEALRAGRDSAEYGGEVADSDSLRELQPQGGECDERRRPGNSGSDVSDPNSGRGLPWGFWRKRGQGINEEVSSRFRALWATEPDVGRMAHGVAARVDRLKAIGNGQVPLCAAEAFQRLAASF